MAWHMACSTQLSQGKYELKKQLIPGPEFTRQIIGVLIKFRGEQAPLWEASRQCFSKSTFLSINEACYASCGGKATTSTINRLIIRYVFMNLEVHHHQVVVIKHSNKLQLTMKSSLVQKLPRH